MWFVFLFFILFLSLNPPAGGQEYIVGPGDVVRIEVWMEEELSGKFTVSPKGTIKHMLLGEIIVGGLTPSQIEDKTTKALGKSFLKNPKVKVTVEEYHSQRVFVLGEVASPGSYVLKGASSILDVLLNAGGPTRSAGERVSILREVDESGGKKKLKHILVDINKLFLGGDLSQNIAIKNGDIIYVSRLEKGHITTRLFEKRLNVFYIVGEVKNPGAYEMDEGYTVLDAVLQAGGFTEYAASNRTKLIRGDGQNRHTYKLKMGEVMEKGRKDKDMPIQAGDLIIVPESLF